MRRRRVAMVREEVVAHPHAGEEQAAELVRVLLASLVFTHTLLMREMAEIARRAVLAAALFMKRATFTSAIHVTRRTDGGQVAQAHQTHF